MVSAGGCVAVACGDVRGELWSLRGTARTMAQRDAVHPRFDTHPQRGFQLQVDLPLSPHHIITAHKHVAVPPLQWRWDRLDERCDDGWLLAARWLSDTPPAGAYDACSAAATLHVRLNTWPKTPIRLGSAQQMVPTLTSGVGGRVARHGDFARSLYALHVLRVPRCARLARLHLQGSEPIEIQDQTVALAAIELELRSVSPRAMQPAAGHCARCLSPKYCWYSLRPGRGHAAPLRPQCWSVPGTCQPEAAWTLERPTRCIGSMLTCSVERLPMSWQPFQVWLRVAFSDSIRIELGDAWGCLRFVTCSPPTLTAVPSVECRQAKLAPATSQTAGNRSADRTDMPCIV